MGAILQLFSSSINGVVVTWVVAIDPPGVRFPLNAFNFLCAPALVLVTVIIDKTSAVSGIGQVCFPSRPSVYT